MTEQLMYCSKERIITSMYFNNENHDVHLTGLVGGFNDDEILIYHITPRGEYDGFVWVRLDKLYRIDYGGGYERKIALLYELKKQSHMGFFSEENTFLKQLLNYAAKKNLIVTLELGDNMITGTVVGYSNNEITVNVIDEMGCGNGITTVFSKEVITVSCDTDYEQDLALIVNENTGDKG